LGKGLSVLSVTPVHIVLVDEVNHSVYISANYRTVLGYFVIFHPTMMEIDVKLLGG
jgi:hypothetical protein